MASLARRGKSEESSLHWLAFFIGGLQDEVNKMEQWKVIPIRELEGRYEVSSLGRIRRIARTAYYKDGRKRQLAERVLTPHPNPKGYMMINLAHKDHSFTYKLHRLVAVTFIDNPDNLPEVNHKDENKANNSVNNLEWCTHKYNSNYGTRIERSVKNHPSQIGRKLSEETKRKISIANKGHKHTEEWKVNHSRILKEKYAKLT